MRRFTVAGILGLTALAVYAAAAPGADDEAEPERVTLIGTLHVWMYPGSELRGGATMSDGGDPSVSDLKMRSVLVTSDPVEKVIAYYAEKFPDSDAGNDGVAADAAPAERPSVCIQDDSENRPVTLRVINVNEAGRSTTLVISRAAGESETHIVWTQYRRFPTAG